MTLSLQEISDRFELQDLANKYADIIDKKTFDQLRDIFTQDAYIDYSATGGAAGNLEEIIAFLKDAMTIFLNSQHLNANIQIKVSGDEAIGRVMCFNPMETRHKDGSRNMFMCGIWYVDKYVRTPKGWRIKERVEEKSWMLNAVPGVTL